MILSISGYSQFNTISLSGKWDVKLDLENEWVKKNPEQSKVEGSILLPGSLAENGFGYKTEGSDYGILTPEFKYIGKASYSRDILIPGSWKNKEVDLFLERVLWESRIFIDGKEISRQDALGTPHVHRLGKLDTGLHKLTVVVDNEMIHNIGDKGHAYSDYTQSIWNGVLGRIELNAFDPMRITNVRTFSETKNDKLKLEINTNALPGQKIKIVYSITSVKTGKAVLNGYANSCIVNSEKQVVISVPVQNRLQLWSEFNPEVYLLKISMYTAGFSDSYETEFGYYQVEHNGSKILINGSPVFLRGNLDCVHFPLTGYPSCKVEDWERIFKIYKEYGLNHVRFHSWCPPEAAFKAANRVGIYIQAEASIWIDWWMSTDMISQGRPEMDTKGHPSGLGLDPKRDSFVVAEMNRMVDTYGNNPSFTMFCIGNELGNSDFNVMKSWIGELKKKDPRRLYASSTARQITEVDDYMATHYIPDLGATRGLKGPKTDWDFEETYGKMNIPIIAHEIGQWPVYPRWSEIEKYKGVLKARNLQEFKLQAEKNGIASQSDDFANASGALNQIMYKYETESFLRTPSCAGVQLLSMQDYQGQGEALIGWLDSHWESKRITTPEKFREHFTTTVPLLRMSKFVWTNDEIFKATAQLSHHGEKPFESTHGWTIKNEKKEVVANGNFDKKTFTVGSLTDLGTIEWDLSSIKKNGKYTISVDGANYKNSWDIWVYPSKIIDTETNDIIITNELSSEITKKLEAGGKVLLLANQLGTSENSVTAQFYPLYWSLTFFPGQGKTNIGLLVQNHHSAFANFTTDAHSDWQWEPISSDAKGFVLNGLPSTYLPIAQPIDDFHRNNKIGSIFELRVGKGKLLVCGYNLISKLPVAKQLKRSLLNYMETPEFNPMQAVGATWLKALFPLIPKAEKFEVSDEFKGAILYVDAAVKLKEESSNWKAEFDDVKISDKTSYKVKAEGMWKNASNTSWYGEKIILEIDCPPGFLGTIFIHFHDWNKNGRSGILDFEGRKVKLDQHDGKGQWVKFNVMREDSNDGKLILKANSTTGPNLMITKVVLTKE